MQDTTKLKVKALLKSSLGILIVYLLVLAVPSFFLQDQSGPGEPVSSGHRIRGWTTWLISSAVTIFFFSIGTAASVYGDHSIVIIVRLVTLIGVTVAFSLYMASTPSGAFTESAIHRLYTPVSYVFGSLINLSVDWLYWLATKEDSDDSGTQDTYLASLKRDTPISWIIDLGTWIRGRGSQAQAEGAVSEADQNGDPCTSSASQSPNVLWQAQGKLPEVSGLVERRQSSYHLLGNFSSESIV